VEFEIRKLRHPDELKDVIKLQAMVGGLPPGDTMSPITLTALTIDPPCVGWVLGAFHDQKMISFIISFATAEPDAAYGHMLGVLQEYQNSSVGLQMLQRTFELFRKDGISRCYTTFEPLESRNAYIYLNRLGGRGIAYKEAHYYIDSGLRACPRTGFWWHWMWDTNRPRVGNRLPCRMFRTGIPLPPRKVCLRSRLCWWKYRAIYAVFRKKTLPQPWPGV